MRPAPILAMLMLCGSLCACTGVDDAADAGPATFSGAPLTTLVSDSGTLSLAVRSDPQPLVRGVDAIQLVITNTSGVPIDGLSVAVDPWMPVMGHGSSTTPTVVALGGGIYEVSDVYMAMPGTWQLRITISGSVTDSATPSFQIP